MAAQFILGAGHVWVTVTMKIRKKIRSQYFRFFEFQKFHTLFFVATCLCILYLLIHYIHDKSGLEDALTVFSNESLIWRFYRFPRIALYNTS
jgi:hypothetical protein